MVGAGFGLLQADDVGMGAEEPGDEAFAFGGADAIDIPGEEGEHGESIAHLSSRPQRSEVEGSLG